MQELTTYFDDTRYDNLTSLKSDANVSPDKLTAKLAKLSALDNVRTKVKKINEELKNKNEEVSIEKEPEVSVAEEEKEIPAEPTTDAIVNEEPKVESPSKDTLIAKLEGNGVTVYNSFNKGVNDAEVAFRKLRVAPQVTESVKNVTNVVGVEHEVDNRQDVNQEMGLEVSNLEPNQETPEAYDFGALPGVGENNEVSTDVAYEENIHTEQDDRLNEYLNRENNDVDYTSNDVEIQEIRKLKREIEEARQSLMQVKQNVGDLQQKDSAISEQLAAYKKSLMQERDAVNAELVDQTREWNDLTQLVRQKEELIDNEESYGMGKAA